RILPEDAAQLRGESLSRFGIHLDLRDVVDLILDRILKRDDVALKPVDLAQAGVERRALAGPRRAANDEHAVRLLDDLVTVIAHLVALAKLGEAGNLLGLVQKTHGHLLAHDAAGGSHAKINGPLLHLCREAAVLRLALLGDVHGGQHLEDVDDRIAHVPAERIGRLKDAIDSEPGRDLFLRRLEVDVGGAGPDSVVDKFARRLVSLRTLGAGHARRVLVYLVEALADEMDWQVLLLWRLVPSKPHL